MNNKIMRLFSLLLILFCLVGCGNKNGESVNTETKESTVEMSTSDMNLVESSYQMDEFLIKHEKDVNVETFAFSGGKVYYSVNYSFYYENNEGDAEEKQFDKTHNTQIRVYDTVKKIDEVLYQYEEAFCVHISDMQCNGKYLIWEDYGIDDTIWRVNSLNLERNEEPKICFTNDTVQGQLDTITLSITSDSIYWYDLNKSEDGSILYKYNLNSEEVSTVKEDIDTSTPYTHVSIMNDALTTYRYVDDKTEITIESSNGEKKIEVEGNITNAQSDGQICAWLRGTDSNDRSRLYVLDINNNVTYVINCDYIFSFSIRDGFIFVNQNNGIYMYDVINKQYSVIKESDGIYCGYMYYGLNELYTDVNTISYDTFSVAIINK